jgi:hypothetical protein
MPPVEVPATKSKRSAIRFFERFSISASTVAGITPRIPPPSMERMRTFSAMARPYPR